MPSIANPGVSERIRGYYRAHGADINTISPELVPVAIIDDLTGISATDPSYERPYGLAATLAGVAAQKFVLYFANPANSGVLATVERLWLRGSTSIVVSAGLADSATPRTTAGNPRDNRLPSGSACKYDVATAVTPSTGNIFQAMVAYSTQSVEHTLSCILKPGDTLFLAAGTVNAQVWCALNWTERSLLYLPGP